MCKKALILLPILLLVISQLLGCGIKNALPEKKVPSLDSYSSIVVILFNDEPTEKYGSLPTQLSYAIGTMMSIKYEDKVWYYDQTERVSPVKAKLDELNIRESDMYKDYSLATSLANALQADLIIIGRLKEPKFTEERSGKIEYDMSDATVVGAARYYSIYQTAILTADFEIIDPKAGQAIWDGRIIGYKKYKTRYRTGNPPLLESEKTMIADLRKDFAQKVTVKLSPTEAK